MYQARPVAPQTHHTNQSLWDKIWKDNNGKYVIWQMPNAALIAWAVLTVISLLISGRPSDVLSWLASAALIIWSLLEVFKGANYFRRALGLLVLIVAIKSLINNL